VVRRDLIWRTGYRCWFTLRMTCLSRADTVREKRELPSHINERKQLLAIWIKPRHLGDKVVSGDNIPQLNSHVVSTVCVRCQNGNLRYGRLETRVQTASRAISISSHRCIWIRWTFENSLAFGPRGSTSSTVGYQHANSANMSAGLFYATPTLHTLCHVLPRNSTNKFDTRRSIEIKFQGNLYCYNAT
jgi:hypothetical protein